MRQVGVLEAKTHLSALLDAIEKDGEAVMITRHGRAVAKLSPPDDVDQPRAPRKTSAAELVRRFQALRDSIAEAHPETDTLTWEELKRDARQ